jgi:peptide/nickel transport system permease protein
MASDVTAAAPGEELPPDQARHRLGNLASAWRANRLALIGGAVLLLMLLAAYLAPLPHNPFRPESGATLQAPSAAHWLGTDRSGFDVFSRTIVAARLDLPLAMIGALLSMLIGVPIGLAASSKGRWEEVIMRALDMFQAFPLLVLAIVIVALTGNNLRNVVVAILLINVPRFIRLTRSEALGVRESRFMEATRAIGVSPVRALWRHLLPNIAGTILAQASLAAAHAIVIIAALSFIGVGVQPTDASWGSAIRSGAANMSTGEWWIALAPGMAVFIAVLSFNAIADGILNTFESDR